MGDLAHEIWATGHTYETNWRSIKEGRVLAFAGERGIFYIKIEEESGKNGHDRRDKSVSNNGVRHEEIWKNYLLLLFLGTHHVLRIKAYF
jgi:hypothetical protein